MFHFKTFSLHHEKSTLKIGTDSVLLASIVPVNLVNSVLDIGCGCGVIAFCLACKMQQITHPENSALSKQITGIDIDESSIKEALLNHEIFPKDSSFSFDFQKTSLQDFAKQHFQKFDLIVSNPPYFSHSLKPDEQNHRKSKHRDENLSFEELIHSVLKLLNDEAVFYLILPPPEQKEFEKIASGKLYLFEQWEISPTPYKKANRLISGYRLQKTETIQRKKLIIRGEDQQFTSDYKKLTGLFYL